MTTPTIEARVQATEECEGPGLPLVARLYQSGRYRRATVDTAHHGVPLTYLAEAGEWRQKALLRKQMIEDLTAERDSLSGQLAALRSLADSATQVPREQINRERRFAFLDAMTRGTHHRMWSLLERAMNQLDAWQKAYGEHAPDWLPPAGDVQLMEDFADFQQGRNKDFSPTPQAATQGEAVAWQWRTKLDAAEGKDWVNCSREVYERAREYEDCETRALAVINEPAPAPSKEQTP